MQFTVDKRLETKKVERNAIGSHARSVNEIADHHTMGLNRIQECKVVFKNERRASVQVHQL
jgi:hypothetical protein